MTPLATTVPGSGAGPVPALIVGDGERRRLRAPGSWVKRIQFCDRIGDLLRRLDDESVAAVVIETRDADGAPVPAAIRAWVELNPLVPIVVWTAGSDSALREVLDLSRAGGDVRLILRPRQDLTSGLDRLLAPASIPHPGAVPSLLRSVVLPAPTAIQAELTLAVYRAWPHPAVGTWAESLGLSRQALNGRLNAVNCGTASVVLDYFSAAEIAIRLTLGMRLKDIAAAMSYLDDRPLRRRLDRLGSRPEQLRDEADFRALLPRIAAGVRRRT